ncbi:MAG TPA: TonB-dependent receptor plug domain-containing protein, partial [Opitutus sp.]|nr:TonB-dependent receptor plug domain-containing protein [Opitutus sp.]
MRNLARFVAAAGFACHGLIALAQTDTTTKTPSAPTEPIVVLDRFVVGGGEDPTSLMPNQPINVLGLSQKIVETPRSVSVVSGETIERFNITELADLSRFSPSTYTAFSFGVQGGLQIRGDTADTYFGDMKKLN